jgi:NADPH:quinone reductase-like Zn-dependent oxidoreductase
MKAIVVHRYGGPEELKFEDYADPVLGRGEVLVQVAATSVNPFDMMRRSGAAKDFAPIAFPGIVGVDLSGTVVNVGPGVQGFSEGDQVFGMADQTYAELSVVKASSLAKIPAGLDLVEAAALPLVTTTGNQLISVGTGIKAGQTVLVTGAVGSVGRSAVFTAKDRGAVLIAGVLKRQAQEAASLGADRIVATDDEKSMASLPELDAVADTVNGKTAEALIAKVKGAGVFATVLGIPTNATDYPSVKVVPVNATPDAKILLYMAAAVKDGKFQVPIGRKLSLKDAAQGHTGVAGSSRGKTLLVVRES